MMETLFFWGKNGVVGMFIVSQAQGLLIANVEEDHLSASWNLQEN